MPRTSRELKTFSLKQANLTLPLVSRVVRDIVQARRRMKALHEEAPRLPADDRKGRTSPNEAEILELSRQCEDCIRELAQVGCEIKDVDRGLVDFPARIDERVVYLCWELGEPEITHWHELDSGFSGRKPARGVF